MKSLNKNQKAVAESLNFDRKNFLSYCRTEFTKINDLQAFFIELGFYL